jgi:hypothetical protein
MTQFNVDVSQFDGNDEKCLRHYLSKIALVKNPVVAELGCWAGKSTSIICEFFEKIGGGTVCSIDWFNGCETTFLNDLAKNNDVQSIFRSNMKELGYEKYVKLYPMKTNDAVVNFEDNTFDLIFIDADHRYNAIRDDINLWLPKLKKNGVMCGHDFNSFEYDEKYIHDDCVNGIHHGVTKAVTEAFQLFEVQGSIWGARREDAIVKSC